MTHLRMLAGGLAVILALVVPGHAQQPTPQRATGTVNQGVTAVLVDVVVRDRRGQPVRDLTQADFEVLEDGVRQNVGSFSGVFEFGAGPAPDAPSSSAPGASSAAAGPTTAVNGPTVTAIVFDRLTPEARRLAVQAAQDYLGTKEETPGATSEFSGSTMR